MIVNNTANSIVNQYQLDTCLNEARDVVVEVERYLRGNAPDVAMKSVRQVRTGLYSIFAKADEAGASAFSLSKEVEALTKRFGDIKAAYAVSMH